MNKNLCFIPAKSNSERLENKNSLLVFDKPLYFYPIRCAINSKLFNKEDIIFSSDSVKMIQNAQLYGANAPYIRNKELTKNTTRIIDVILDFFEKFERYKTYDNLFIGLSTSPLVKPLDYQKAFELFTSGQYNTLLSVKKNSNSIYQSFKIDSNFLKPVFESNFIKSNSKEATFHPDGNVHIIKIKKLLELKSYVVDPVVPFEISSKYKIDIDEKSDFEYIMYLIEKNLISI